MPELWWVMSVTFGATTVHSSQGVLPWFAEDESILKRFADFLADAKEK